MKSGDKLYCYNSIDTVVTSGKYYEILRIDFDDFDDFRILDDKNHFHYFSFDKYKNWFLSEKEVRKLKLERLNKI